MPLARGSYRGLLVFVAVLPARIWRLLEEKFLAKNLPGYVEYCAKVRWRLIEFFEMRCPVSISPFVA
jgi:protein-S-isoprenylcysteine O-methyltransferase Ste14